MVYVISLCFTWNELLNYKPKQPKSIEKGIYNMLHYHVDSLKEYSVLLLFTSEHFPTLGLEQRFHFSLFHGHGFFIVLLTNSI